ncbi:MAG: glycerophosphodiester phosphodiesterase family protein [Desulfatiglandales bacterium]
MRIYAHRGSSLIWPENTRLAFKLAHEAGATGFEADLRLSKDHQIVLSHDATLTRFGLSAKSISNLTADELCKIDICSPDGFYTAKLTTLKTLLKAHPDKDYIFDCKISDELLFHNLKNLLAELEFHNRVWFLTWSEQADNHVRQIFPGYKIFPRANSSKVWGWFSMVGLGYLFEPKNQILSLPAYHRKIPLFWKRQIGSIHARGKRFVGYLINSKKELERCIACKVEIVLTDRPDLIRGESLKPNEKK